MDYAAAVTVVVLLRRLVDLDVAVFDCFDAARDADLDFKLATGFFFVGIMFVLAHKISII